MYTYIYICIHMYKYIMSSGSQNALSIPIHTIHICPHHVFMSNMYKYITSSGSQNALSIPIQHAMHICPHHVFMCKSLGVCMYVCMYICMYVCMNIPIQYTTHTCSHPKYLSDHSREHTICIYVCMYVYSNKKKNAHTPNTLVTSRANIPNRGLPRMVSISFILSASTLARSLTYSTVTSKLSTLPASG